MKNLNSDLILIRSVSKEYKDKRNQVKALNDVSIKIEQGSFVAITGESGAGKTTLLNIIGLIDNPTDGEYILLQEDVLKMTENKKASVRNSSFGYILQEYGLIENYTVYENVEIPLLYSKDKITREEKQKKISTILKQLGLEDKMHVKAKNLSGGQRQRVSIARALINQPKIIIADEPTAALDKENKIGILKLLKSINESQNITVIVVSHDLEVEKYADRIIRLEKGKIV